MSHEECAVCPLHENHKFHIHPDELASFQTLQTF